MVYIVRVSSLITDDIDTRENSTEVAEGDELITHLWGGRSYGIYIDL